MFTIVDRSVYIHSYTFYSHHPSKSRAYFYCCFIAYILGLGTTITVMHVFRAAQPALLYLVPTCVGLPLLLSVVRGEIQPLLKYVNKIFILQYDRYQCLLIVVYCIIYMYRIIYNVHMYISIIARLQLLLMHMH